MEAYFRACILGGVRSMLKWGMCGVDDPAEWDLSQKTPGTQEYLDNLKKIARQWAVVQAYARRYFPDIPFDQLIEKMMAARVLA
jgi:hypothetical protein